MLQLVRSIVAAAVLLVCAGPAAAQQLSTVVRWNEVMSTAMAVPGAHPATVFVTRPLAMVNVAMFDAANSFERRFQPYATVVTPADGASPDAAVSQAAHDVLVALLPTQRTAFDAALETILATLPSAAARDGAAVGAAAAAAVLELRTGDGWEQPFPALDLPALPGYWRPTPPANAAATFTNYPHVLGFIVPNGRQFMTEGPPALTSERYARDFNQTKTIGAANSTVRTAEQTQAARLWASVGTSTPFWHVWNQVIGQAARRRVLTGLEATRAYALVSMAQHDALLTSFTSKYIYGLWRPVTAIREAHTDGNGDTERDAAWSPLVPTPPYPGHPGNMACLGAAQARVMERLMGRDDVPFEVTWVGAGGPDVTRSYLGFHQLADEEGMSRIWGGIHFMFENQASVGACSRLGDYAADNVLRAR